MDGIAYPLEVHLVHLLRGDSDPLNNPLGAAVIGVFFKSAKKAPKTFIQGAFANFLADIPNKGDSV